MRDLLINGDDVDFTTSPISNFPRKSENKDLPNSVVSELKLNEEAPEVSLDLEVPDPIFASTGSEDDAKATAEVEQDSSKQNLKSSRETSSSKSKEKSSRSNKDAESSSKKSKKSKKIKVLEPFHILPNSSCLLQSLDEIIPSFRDTADAQDISASDIDRYYEMFDTCYQLSEWAC